MTLSIKRSILFLSLWVLISNTALALDFPSIGDSLGISPFLNYKTIETEHFRITYPDFLKKEAEQAASYYEEAHHVLAPALKWEARYRASVLLIDSADAANGLTTAVQRFGMVLYVTPPDHFFSTSYYDDWYRLLVFHEYVHFLNIDATRGIYEPLRILFGDLLMPNALLPSWMLEGLAVYYETRLTHAGRGRSPYYEMILRAAVEKDLLGKSEWANLGRVNTSNPYFPGGETPYLFGYQMMNEAVRNAPAKETADGNDDLEKKEDVLGVMSLRSSRRIPFFINGNLQNLIGKSWYELWDQWIIETQSRMKSDLAKINSQPVSQFKSLTPGSYQVLGSDLSPDGKWLVYMIDSLDEPSSIRLRNLQTGEDRNIFNDRVLGSTLHFTPDSKHIAFSSLHRVSNYKIYSELHDYSLESDSVHTITSQARARDPQISPDGKEITFTVTTDATTSLARATVSEGNKKLKIGVIQVLWSGPRYSRVSTPVYSPDGRSIVFAYHENQKTGEDIALFDLKTQKVSTLVSNGHFNRMPVFSAVNLKLYFISDITGVDNLFEYNESGWYTQKTNTTTGIAFANLSKNKTLVSHFTPTGWELAETTLLENADSAKVTVAPPTAPEIDSLSTSNAKPNEGLSEKEYSIWPSILPRQWAPVLLMSSTENYVGGQVLGFDTLDRHRYILFGAYNSLLQNADWLALYSNRSLGVNLNFSAEEMNQSGYNKYFFLRKRVYTVDASYPFQFTRSTLSPFAAIHGERTTLFEKTASSSEAIYRSRFVPSTDLGINYSDTKDSRLSVTHESGGSSTVSARRYIDSEIKSVKGFAQDVRYTKLFSHVTLSSNIRASATSKFNGRYGDSDVIVEGRKSRIIAPFDGEGLDQMNLRGYPNEAFYAKSAAIGSLDLKFPVARIFEAWGTNPIALQNLYGVAFAESAVFPDSTKNLYLPSTGGGLRLSTEFFLRVPLTFALEYHTGLRAQYGGTGETFFAINVDPFSF